MAITNVYGGVAPPQGVPVSFTDNGLGLDLQGTFTYNTLPIAGLFPNGTRAFTSDAGLYIVESGVWTPVSTSGGGGTKFSSSVTAALGLYQDNFDPTGYIPGTTNRLLLNPVSGNSTLYGLLAAPDGWAVQISNQSTTYTIIIPHQTSSTQANQFTCPSGQSASIVPLGSVLALYVANSGWNLV